MKAKELIKTLEKYPEATITFALQTETKRYPSCYIVSHESEFEKRGHEWFINHDGHVLRMLINLPEGFTIHERKKKTIKL